MDTVVSALSGAGIDVPSTQAALWVWLRSDTDRGDLVHRALALEASLEPTLTLDGIVDGFRYGGDERALPMDLTGYEDGTENPTGTEAVEAALVTGIRGARRALWRGRLEAAATLQ